MLAIVDRFARYGLPLHLTETSLVSGDLMPADIVDLNDYQVAEWPSTPEGEARQADEIERHYRSLVAHPAVEAITYWGITDDGAWLGAPIGLVRADGTPKPSYEALRRLVKEEWWIAPTTGHTDDERPGRGRADSRATTRFAPAARRVRSPSRRRIEGRSPRRGVASPALRARAQGTRLRTLDRRRQFTTRCSAPARDDRFHDLEHVERELAGCAVRAVRSRSRRPCRRVRSRGRRPRSRRSARTSIHSRSRTVAT